MTFATEQANLDDDDLRFLTTLENPVSKILEENCQDWTVDDLYTALVDSGAGGIADRYL